MKNVYALNKTENNLNIKNNNKICKKARQKLNTLPRVTLYMKLWKSTFCNRFL